MEKLFKVEILGNELQLYADDEERYFSAKEVGEILEYSLANISKMVSKVDENEKKQICVHTNSTSTKARNQYQWFLTKDGLHELLFQSRKPIAKEFKKEIKRILKNIEQNGFYISTERDEKWFGVRQDTKNIRRDETDAIKEFVEYAKEQGSSKPEWYYKHFTNLVRNKLEIPNNVKRDNMDQKLLRNISSLEGVICMKLPKLIDKNMPYKEVYEQIKKLIKEI